MLDDPSLGIEGNQIIVLIIPGHCEGTDDIERTILPVMPRLLNSVLEVLELDLLVLRNPTLNGINVVVDGLVHRLDPVFYIDLTVEELRFVDAGQRFNLLNQRCGLLVGDEFGGLNAIDQQLQLRQLKTAVGNIVAGILAGPTLHDVQAKNAQRLDVIVNTFPFTGNPMCGEMLNQLAHRNQMVFI